MEFPNLGDRCSFTGCNQLDFLIFKCDHCRLIFCKSHASIAEHNCPVPTDRHITDEEAAEKPLSFKCSTELCEKTDPLEMKCGECQKHFCLDHRHHGCKDKPQSLSKREKERLPKEQFKKAKAETDIKVHETLKAAKNRTLANKIKLMKIKGSAKGSKNIPQADRMYFLVAPPLQGKDKSTATGIFIDKNFNIGKSIDAIARILKVENTNNDLNTPQLRLFNTDGEIISNQLSASLQDFISNATLIDGDSLILEYVTNEEIEKNIQIFIEERCLSKYKFV